MRSIRALFVIGFVALFFSAAFSAELTSLPQNLAAEKFYGANLTLEQAMSVLPGEKSYEIEGRQLIVRAIVVDKLSRNTQEHSYLIEKLSDTPIGSAHKQIDPNFPDAYFFTRVIQNGVELLEPQVREFNLAVAHQAAIAFPQKEAAQKNELPKELNTDLTPGVKVFTCTNCYNISKKDAACSNCGTPMRPMQGYLCPRCSKTHSSYGNGTCDGCGTAFLTEPKKVPQMKTSGDNRKKN